MFGNGAVPCLTLTHTSKKKIFFATNKNESDQNFYLLFNPTIIKIEVAISTYLQSKSMIEKQFM